MFTGRGAVPCQVAGIEVKPFWYFCSPAPKLLVQFSELRNGRPADGLSMGRVYSVHIFVDFSKDTYDSQMHSRDVNKGIFGSSFAQGCWDFQKN
jgi:hypothetical protein